MKTKRILTALLLLCVAVVATVALSSCNSGGKEDPANEHQHELTAVAEVKATCTENGTEGYYTCSGCDKLFADADGSVEIEAPKVIEASGHDYKKTVYPNSCTEAGYTKYTCFDCDYSYNADEVAAKGHSFTNYAYNNNATCEADGTKTAKCDNCDATDTKADEGSKKGHSFTNYAPNNDATCETDGTKTAKCDNCDATDTKADEGSKKGHAYGDTWASDESGHWHICANGCGIKGSESIHTPDRAEATEYDSVVCTVCDYVIASALGHTTHNYNVPQSDESHHWNKCYGCNEIDEKIAHSYTENIVADATCTESGSKTLECTCGYSKNEIIPALNHNEIAHEAKAPTCTDKGWDAYVTCSRCDYTTYVEKAAIGHDEQSHAAQSPTCTAIGWDAYVTCSRCDYTTYVEIPANGHKHTSVVTAPTCEAAGYTTYTCSCGDTYVADNVAALGHDEITHEAKAPTCTAIGWEAYVTCCRCDYTTYVEIPANGHSYGEWSVAIAPTYDIEGTLSRTCAICKGAEEKNIGILSADNGYTLIITGVLSRWTYTVDEQTFIFDIKENTTTTEYLFGLESFYIGSNDAGSLIFKEGYKYTNATPPKYDCCFMDGAGRTFTTTVVVPETTSVIFIVQASGKASSSVTYSGLISSLTVNGESSAVLSTTSEKIVFEDWHKHNFYEIATIVLEKGVNVIQFTSNNKTNYAGVGFKATKEVHMHTDVIDPAVAPTCTETGKTEGMHCSTCNAVIVAQETVAATGHINAWTHTMTTAPTYTTEGLIESVEACTVCKLVNSTNSFTVPAVSSDVDGYELLVTGVASRWQYIYDGTEFIVDVMESGVITNNYSFGTEAWYVDRNDIGTPIGVSGFKYTDATWNSDLFYAGGDKTYTTTIVVDKPTAVTLIINAARNKAKPFYSDTGAEHVLDWIKVNGSEAGVIYDMTAQLNTNSWTGWKSTAVATLYLEEGTNVISFNTSTTTNFKGIGFMSTEEIKLAEDIVEIDLMSFNIRVNEDWAARKVDLMASIIKYNPGVVCFQEVSKTQANDLSNGLTAAGYEFIWYARQSGDNPEGLAIAYRTDLFNKVSDGVFWLSDTPNTMSKGWDDKYYRICVHALLQHKTSGQYLNVFSVHLGLTVTSQVNGMQLILDEAAKYDYPTYIAGDFNCYDYSTAYLNTAKSFIDCQKRAPKTEISNTFHSWGKYAEDGTDHIIDFCFVSKNHFVPLEFAVHQDKVSDGSSYLSDHFPIMTKVALLVPHTHTEKVDEAVDSGCESTGLTEGKHCTSCGKVLVAQEATEMLGHIYTDSSDADCDRCGFVRDFSCAHANKVAVSAKDATCTEAGNTAGEMCTDCGEVFVDEIFPALGHTNAAAVIENEVTPTFDAAGSFESVVYCSVCNAEVSRDTIVLSALNFTDYTSSTTVDGTTVTTTFVLGTVNYSTSLVSDDYVSVDNVIYSRYEMPKLCDGNVIASYDSTNGYTYHAENEKELTQLSQYGHNLTLTGKISIVTDSVINVIGGNFYIGTADVACYLKVKSSVTCSITVSEAISRLIQIAAGSTLDMSETTGACAIRFSHGSANNSQASTLDVYGTLITNQQISFNRRHGLIVREGGTLECGSINNGRYNHIQVYGTMNVKGDVTQTESAKITVHDGGEFTIGGNAAIQSTLTVNGKMYVAGKITGVSTFTIGATGRCYVIGTANKVPTVTDGGYAKIGETEYGTPPASSTEE